MASIDAERKIMTINTNESGAACPFCGGKSDPEGWLRNDGLGGPECEKCGATAPTLEVWNQRQSSPQPAKEAAGEWVMVPREATPEVRNAYWSAVENEPDEIIGDLPALAKHRYSAMLAAAPPPPAPSAEPVA